MEKTKLEPDSALMRALNFTEEDLEANRAGWITERQHNHLTNLSRQRLIFALILMASGIALTLNFVCLADNWRVLVLGVLMGMFPVLGSFSLLKVKRTFDLDIRQRQAESSRGFLQFDVWGDESGDTYLIKLDEKVFKVESLAHDAFKEDKAYHIYYAPHSNTLLSAELLSEA